MSKVTRVERSPMNKERWVVSLECGHEEWVSASRRPTRRRMKCTRCERGKPWKRRAPVQGMRKKAAAIQAAFDAAAPWNPVVRFSDGIRRALPAAKVEYDKPDDPAGNHVWDVSMGDKKAVVEFRHQSGFSVDDATKEIAYGSGPDEVLPKAETAVACVVAMLTPPRTPKAIAKKAAKGPSITEVASRIQAHLTRFENDKVINAAARTPHAPVTSDALKPYYMARAWAAGPRVRVLYVNYQGSVTLTKAQAVAYLSWLDKGNVGRHQQAPGVGRAVEHGFGR